MATELLGEWAARGSALRHHCASALIGGLHDRGAFLANSAYAKALGSSQRMKKETTKSNGISLGGGGGEP